MYFRTSWWLLKALVLLQTLISASSGPLGASCIWRSSISPDLPADQQIEPLTQCVEGHLYWYYPKANGTLRVTFRHESRLSTFELCFSSEADVGPVYDIQNQSEQVNVNRFLEKRNGVNRYCLPSQHGQVILEFVSNQDRLRLHIIQYIRTDLT